MRMHFHDAPVSTADPRRRRLPGNDGLPGQHMALPLPVNLSSNATRDPRNDTYGRRSDEPDNVMQTEDIDPELTGIGTNQRSGRPSDSHEIVDTFPNPNGSKYSYFVGEPRPGEWRLFRSQPGNADLAELVKSYGTRDGRDFFTIERYRDSVRVLRFDQALINPGYVHGVPGVKSPATADRLHAELRANMTRDQIAATTDANRRFYAPGHRR